MKNKWIVIIAVIAIIIATIIIISVHKKKHVNHFDFPKTLVVHNNTTYERADTMAMIILNKIFLYDTMVVEIYYMIPEFGNNEIEVQAFIQKNPFIPHTYYLFIKKGSLSSPIDEIISHEMIHVKQMKNGVLVELGGDYFKYNGKTYQYSKISYNDRPQEKEAFKDQGKILKELNTLLYSK